MGYLFEEPRFEYDELVVGDMEAGDEFIESDFDGYTVYKLLEKPVVIGDDGDKVRAKCLLHGCPAQEVRTWPAGAKFIRVYHKQPQREVRVCDVKPVWVVKELPGLKGLGACFWNAIQEGMAGNQGWEWDTGHNVEIWPLLEDRETSWGPHDDPLEVRGRDVFNMYTRQDILDRALNYRALRLYEDRGAARPVKYMEEENLKAAGVGVPKYVGIRFWVMRVVG